MTEPIRTLHFADVHVGMENFGRLEAATGISSRIGDYLARVDEMIAFARENEVDLIIFAGDAFKTRTPNQTYQRELGYRILALAELAPLVLLAGNHDLPMHKAKASAIEIFGLVQHPNIWVAQDYEVRCLNTKRGDVIVATAPYPIESRLSDDLSDYGDTIDEQAQTVYDKLAFVVDVLAKEAILLAEKRPAPCLLAAHFTVHGAVWSSERNVMLGHDVALHLETLIQAPWDYVALGHIHKHQNLTAGMAGVPPVVYSGSLERIDFGEEKESKGFCWVELARGATTWDYMPVQARPMKTVRVDCRGDHAPTETVLTELQRHTLKDAIVRVLVTIDAENEALLDDKAIRSALKDADAFYVAGVVKEVERLQRSRLGVNPQGLTPLELLKRYFKGKGVKDPRYGELMERGEKIIDGPKVVEPVAEPTEAPAVPLSAIPE